MAHRASREKDVLHVKAMPSGVVLPVGKRWKLDPPKLGKRKLRSIEKGVERKVREEKRRKREREEALKQQQLLAEAEEKAKEQQQQEETQKTDVVVEEKMEEEETSKEQKDTQENIVEGDTKIESGGGTEAVEPKIEGEGTPAEPGEDETKKEEEEEKREDEEKQEQERKEEAEDKMSEEERLSKIQELEDKLKSLDDQKHKLFLLLKQVISVEEQKRTKQAKEEERLRMEEQQRREGARRLEQLKALSQTKEDPPNMGNKQFIYGGGGRHSSPFKSSAPSRFGPHSGGVSPQPGGASQQNGGKSPFHRKHRSSDSGNGSGSSSGGPLSPYNGQGGKSDRSPPHQGAPPSPPSLQMGHGHPQGPRGRGPHGNAPSSMYPYSVVQTVPPFAIPPDSSHFPQVPPVHIPGHIPMGPHGLPLGMLPAQLALQAQLSQHLGLHPYPPHMLARPGPGLLPTPPNQRGGRGRGGDRRRRGGFW